MKILAILAVLLLAGCTTTTSDYISEEEIEYGNWFGKHATEVKQYILNDEEYDYLIDEAKEVAAPVKYVDIHDQYIEGLKGDKDKLIEAVRLFEETRVVTILIYKDSPTD